MNWEIVFFSQSAVIWKIVWDGDWVLISKVILQKKSCPEGIRISFLEKQSIKLWIGLDTAYTLINRFNQHQTKSHKVWNTICIFNMVSNNFSNPNIFSCQKRDIYCRLCRPICGFRKCPVVETCGGFSYLLEWIH